MLDNTTFIDMRYISLMSTNPQSLGDVISFLLQQSAKSETDFGKMIGATQPMINKAKLNLKALPIETMEEMFRVFGLNKEERELLNWFNLKARIIAKKRDGGDVLVEHYETKKRQQDATIATIKAHCLELANAILKDSEHCTSRVVRLAHGLKKLAAPEASRD